MVTDARLSVKLLEWEEARVAGQCVTPRDLFPDSPELAEELGRRIEKLEAMERLLDTGPGRSTHEPEGRDDAEAWPRLAAYEVLGRLGRGGMGVVYRARQHSLGRVVALKMLRDDAFATQDDRARFRREAVTVAGFQHAHIVPVHDFGEDAGRPYFSMELLEGGSLDRKLRGTPLPPKEAAELVEQLARAMDFAHAQGIVHCDLKPGNVLLAADGTPKISDFGLARQLGPGASQGHVGVVGTPSYMAPEQANGEKTGPAADTYALGAILYDALTGRPPFHAASSAETLVQLLGEEPVSPRQLNPQVPRDLETVCLKCLEKDPAKRYPSALALADDLLRFRNGEPTLARPASPAERALKWARRRPAVAGFAAVSAAALLLLVAGGTTFALRLKFERDAADFQRGQAEEQKQRALDSYRLAQEALRECVGKVADDPRVRSGPLQDVRRVMLQSEALFYERFLKLAGDDPAFQAERGQTLRRLGFITAELAPKKEAVGHYLQAADVFRELARTRPDEVRHRVDLANTLNNLANLYQANNAYEDAEPTHRESLALWEAILRDAPGAREHLLGQATSLNNLARLYRATRKWAECKQTHERALALRQALFRDYPENARVRADLAQSYNNLGNLYVDQNRSEHAVRVQQAALALRQALARQAPALAEHQAGVANSHLNLGNAYFFLGQQPKAEVEYRTALTVGAPLAEKYPMVIEYRADLALYHKGVGNACYLANRFAEAEEAYQLAIPLYQALARDDPTVERYPVELGGTHCNVANARSKAGRPAQAVAAYDDAIATLQPVFDRQSHNRYAREFLHNAHAGKATALVEQGRYAEALPHQDKAYELTGSAEARLYRAINLARLREHVRAAAEAGELAKAKKPTGELFFQLARVFALNVTAVPDDESLAEQYASRSIELLTQARAAGLFKKPAAVQQLRERKDFDVLREREDFRALLPQ